MKKLSLISICLLIIHSLTAQSCLEDGITFTTQTQIDSFPINYPGCTEIEGFVRIYGNDITNLNSLLKVSSINGNLSIGFEGGGNPVLDNLNGLQNLTSIGGGLLVNSNDSLENLSGLKNLTSLGRDLSITYNNNLVSLQDLTGLTEIPLGFYFFGNLALKDLDGLNNITSIGDDVYIQLSKLTELSGFENLTAINGNVNISYNDSLLNMSGLDNLSSISGFFWFENNKSLVNLEGLESLTQVQSFRINQNNKLLSLSGIDNIDPDSLTGFKILNNEKLTYCEVLSVCEHLLEPGEFTEIKQNASGCNSIEEVEQACSVSVNEKSFSNHLTNYPNPFVTSTTIEYQLDEPSLVTIHIYNQLGGQVDLIQQNLSKGLHKIVWTPEVLNPGIYHFVIQAGEKVASGQMMLKR